MIGIRYYPPVLSLVFRRVVSINYEIGIGCCCRYLLPSNTIRLKSRLYSSQKRITEDEIRNRILCEDSRKKLEKRFKKRRKIIGPENPKSAAVLMPLCITDDKLSFLYTLRSPFLTNHGGQVSFPGGTCSSIDSSVEATAVRETEEEVGFPRQNIDVWMTLTNVGDRHGKFIITPVVGYLKTLYLEDLNPNLSEVHAVFTMSLAQLLDTENQSYTQFNNGWKMPLYLCNQYKIWGITACLTELFLANAFPDFYKPKFNVYRGDIRKRYI